MTHRRPRGLAFRACAALLCGLIGALVPPIARASLWHSRRRWARRSTASLQHERDALARAIAESRDLGARAAMLRRVGPIARELKRRGVATAAP